MTTVARLHNGGRGSGRRNDGYQEPDSEAGVRAPRFAGVVGLSSRFCSEWRWCSSTCPYPPI